ncbi:MAG: hypothetical protein IT303_07285 [Dehalococcoidia bacterium]|nr:hypothetical protein [Dehalococcoidia bacterium]
MVRPKPGLGQGLEALVTTSSSLAGEPADAPGPSIPVPQPPPLPRPVDRRRWEYALLEKRRPRKRRKAARLLISFSRPEASAIIQPRPTILAARSMWAAIGMLGYEGWEVIRLERRRVYFKRPLVEEPPA